MSIIAEEIRKYHNLTSDYVQAGFEYALKTGELLAEVEEMVGAENLETWLKKNKVEVKSNKVKRLLSFYRNGALTLSAYTEKAEEVNQET